MLKGLEPSLDMQQCAKFNVGEHFGLVFDGLAYMLRMFLTSGARKSQAMENVLTQFQ